MTLNRLADPRHLYVQVADELRMRISTAQYLDRIPSSYDIGEELGVSHLTVRRALELLITEGLIVARQGRGTFIVGRPDNELQALREQVVGIQEQLVEVLARIDGLREKAPAVSAQARP
jgi:DNA-binding GntR family transcriptional regulator